jgi:hypothetical protein
MVQAQLNCRLHWLFDLIAPPAQRQCGDQIKARFNSLGEKFCRDFLEKWYWYVRNQKKSFLPLVDPAGLMLYPPLDAYDTDWEVLVEFKAPERPASDEPRPWPTPEIYDVTSGGIAVPIATIQKLGRFWVDGGWCPEYGFKSCMVVYFFPCGRVYRLTVRDFWKYSGIGYGARFITMANRNNGTPTLAVPSKYWTKIGNWAEGTYELGFPDDAGEPTTVFNGEPCPDTRT